MFSASSPTEASTAQVAAHVTGNAKENFYGVAFKGLTYGGIYTGGEGTYRSSTGTIELKDTEGRALEPVAGKGQPTVMDAVWGFMNHGSATVNLLDGTVVNAEEAVFLSKTGGAAFIVDNAVLNPASGIILQMMDNDDRTVGGSMNAFNTEFKEAAGWPSESGNVTKKGRPAQAAVAASRRWASKRRSSRRRSRRARRASSGFPPEGQFGAPPLENGGGSPDMPPGGRGPGGPGGPGGPAASSAVKLSLANGNYKGNVFNSYGYYNQSGSPLEVTIGKAATLEGAISLTETRHMDVDQQAEHPFHDQRVLLSWARGQQELQKWHLHHRSEPQRRR